MTLRSLPLCVLQAMIVGFNDLMVKMSVLRETFDHFIIESFDHYSQCAFCNKHAKSINYHR